MRNALRRLHPAAWLGALVLAASRPSGRWTPPPPPQPRALSWSLAGAAHEAGDERRAADALAERLRAIESELAGLRTALAALGPLPPQDVFMIAQPPRPAHEEIRVFAPPSAALWFDAGGAGEAAPLSLVAMERRHRAALRIDALGAPIAASAGPASALAGAAA
jgi:hypothetical protein